MQPHAAVDVVADGLRDDEPAGGQHRADRDPAGLVEVGGDGDADDPGVAVEAVGGGLGDLPHGVLEGQQLDQLRHRRGLDGHLLVGEQGGFDPVRVVHPHAVFVESGEARVDRHGELRCDGWGE